jgi:D-serine deaminase-like pyridoxal phosphate-dependent protein
MYVFNDRTVMGAGGASVADCAAVVVATVVARPDKHRIILDAGSKTLSNDRFAHGEGFGTIVGHPELIINKLSEEHGAVDIAGECDLAIGDVVQIIPNHICPVINLTDRLYGFRGGVLERVIEVVARGKNR